MLNRLRAWRPDWFGAPPARLEAIYVAASAGQPMESREAVEATAGSGLSGDRYATHRGHWHAVESCPVTLISSAELERAAGRRGQGIAAGEHRRNLVVSGWHHLPRHGGYIQIGEVVLRVDRPRPPCGYLNQVVGYNLARALGRDSGICVKVTRGGRLRVGDAVHWQETEPT